MREIVTIQVGGYANFVGSHFWNFQDELLGLFDDPDSDPAFLNHQQYLNMDVLFRTGETQKGIPTYTPRLVSVDLQGSLGSLSSRGSLYNDDSSSSSSSVPTWSGSVVTSTSEVHQKNLFLESLYQEEPKRKIDNHSEISDKDIVESLENNVHFWTDFSKVHYHHHSLYELSGLWVNSQEFDNYGIGKDVFSEGSRGEEISEKLRFFTEESDHIQGFQFIADDSGGFSSLSADLLESIVDDYPYIPVLLYTVRAPSSPNNPRNRKQTVSRNIHDAISFSRLSSLSKLIVPLGLPLLGTSKACKFLHVKDEKPYHTSAVYAAAIHSIGLPFRMDTLGPTANSSYASGAMDVNGIIQMLAGQARQNRVAILDTALPSPSLTVDVVQPSFLGSLQSLTPEISEDAEGLHAVESMVVHGALGSGNHRASVSEVTDAVSDAYETLSTRPMFSHLSTARCPLPIPMPFPSIFGTLIGKQGELLLSNNATGPPSSSPRGSLDVHSVPMAARLRSSAAILPYLENRLVNLRKLGINHGAPGGEIVQSWGFGKDELEDMEQNLSKMVATLDPHSQSSSSESD
ncbi:Protein misato homolog 1 [Linum perenne]